MRCGLHVWAAGRPGLYFAISMKLRDPDARGDRDRAQPARRHLRLGRGAVGRRAGQPGSQRSGQRRRDPRELRLLGRHRRGPRRASHGVGRARLCRDRPDEDADDPAGPRPRTGRRAAVSRPRSRPVADYQARLRHAWSPRDGLNSRVRTESGRAFPARHRHARNASSSGSARIRNSTTPSPSSSRRPSTAGSGPMPTSSTPTPRPSSWNAARRPGTPGASRR